MAYEIESSGDGSAVTVHVPAGPKQGAQLLASFQDCQQGRCGCPTDQYDKLAGMDIEPGADGIRLSLQARAGEAVDVEQLRACLDYTTASVDSGEQSDR